MPTTGCSSQAIAQARNPPYSTNGTCSGGSDPALQQHGDSEDCRCGYGGPECRTATVKTLSRQPMTLSFGVTRNDEMSAAHPGGGWGAADARGQAIARGGFGAPRCETSANMPARANRSRRR